MTSQIIKLKIHRNEAGMNIPFDTLYFVPEEEQELIPKIFQYALVLPVDELMLDKLTSHVSPNYVKTTTGPLHEKTVQDPVDGSKDWWDKFISQYDITERLVVVPILVRKARKKLSPRYLATQRWWRMYSFNNEHIHRALEQGRVKRPIPETAYLVTPLPEPYNKVQPVCSVCKRTMHSLIGKCVPGMPICYQSLDLNKIISTGEGEIEEDVDASV